MEAKVVHIVKVMSSLIGTKPWRKVDCGLHTRGVLILLNSSYHHYLLHETNRIQ